MLSNLLNSKDKKKLFENFISLFFLQGMNYLLPLITFPYLVKVLGVEKFGVLALSTAVIAYFAMLTDYGFNITATRDISINKDNTSKISEIFSSVMIIKIIFGVLSFVALYVLVYFIDAWNKYQEIYLLTFGSVIGQILLPIWFYQGMEKMKFFSIFNVLAKILGTIAIFLFVKEENDAYIVPLVNSLAMIFSGIISFFVIFQYFKVSFSLQKITIIMHYISSGWHVFVSSFFSNFYRNFNVLVLGFFTNDLFVGYYAIAEKAIKIIQMAQEIIGNVLFPYFSAKFVVNNRYFFDFNKRCFPYIFLAYFILSISVFLFASDISILLNGGENTAINIKIMSIVILIGGLNYYFGILGLLSMGLNKVFSKCILVTGIINILLSAVLVYSLYDVGASLSLVVSEGILLFLLILNITKIHHKQERFREI